MANDKYSAIWVSHSSISDFQKCPRSYFLKHRYKDPKTNNKIKLTSPALSLGQAVHEVIESLSIIPTDRRFSGSLISRYDEAWEKVSGKRGGFMDDKTEATYKNRGLEMIKRVKDNPGPLTELAVKIKEELPHYWLSEEDNIILCGKVDWLKYNKGSDSVEIIDFKTGKNTESDDSLQLPIYHLLVHNCQHRKVDSASYWYIDSDNDPIKKDLPDLEDSKNRVMLMAKKIKLARQLDNFKCPEGEEGCMYCKPIERIIRGEAIFVGNDEYNYDVYILPDTNSIGTESEII